MTDSISDILDPFPPITVQLPRSDRFDNRAEPPTRSYKASRSLVGSLMLTDAGLLTHSWTNPGSTSA
ncbi:hypothetical protein N7520_009442 [Penicillium odoratum]|uniref:uncharacterized protein n=1 Tax=Penicillium odoratum TaxID=1167516 RepID=UPI002548CCB0|nr:uncharacterized protein N7520_009442 [Penicillium odoratum]KAJ5752525.1 hypothetical protein N7520_009442 [Penicillium odoratum]